MAKSYFREKWYSLNFSVFSTHLQIVISKGVSEPRVFISGRVALRDLVFTCQNKRSLAPIRALKTARPHGRELRMTICLIKTVIDSFRCCSSCTITFSRTLRHWGPPAGGGTLLRES